MTGTGPGGVLILSREGHAPDGGYLILVVEVFAGQTKVYANATNTGAELTDDGNFGVVARDQPPLTVPQLIAITPELHLFR